MPFDRIFCKKSKDFFLLPGTDPAGINMDKIGLGVIADTALTK